MFYCLAMKEVRTRFAPSPTGFLHIGGARTAFWAFLLARNLGGKFLLRVEDTDQDRRVEGAIASLLRELSWFGIEIDEGPSHDELKQVGENTEGLPKLSGSCGPYIQSLRKSRYEEVADQLVGKGACYRCDCTAEMLEKERLDQMARRETPGYSGYCRDRNVSKDKPHVVRFRMPFKKAVVLEDAVKGKVVWEDPPLKDPVLMKSDGFPTYHLAVVVDDHDMRVSHVLRGDEWLSSAPLHVLLYEALQWEKPTFAHLPVILGPQGKKLSKREGDVFTSSFRDAGYLPQALLNFTALIGWSPGEGEEQEIFSREELTKKFSLDRINQASGKFDYEKLGWMNGMYIRAMPLPEFTALAKQRVVAAGLAWNEEIFAKVAPLVQERVKTLAEIAPTVEFLFREEIEREIDAMFGKGVDKEVAKSVLQQVGRKLLASQEFSKENLDQCFKQVAEEMKLKTGPLFGIIRIAVTGKKSTPPLAESLLALGKEKTLRRIEQTIEQL